MADPRVELAAKAEKAWSKYASAVRSGGTPQQRRFAFKQARVADEKLAELELRMFGERQAQRRAAA